MPNQTEKYKFPSPKPNEAADGPTGFQQLAQRIEDVLITDFGKVVTGESAEIKFRGGTSLTDLLYADLKGVRSGNWAVSGNSTVAGTSDLTGTVTARGGLVAPAGSLIAENGYVYAGKAGGATSYSFRSMQRYNNIEYEGRFYTSSGDTVVSLLKGGVGAHHFYVEDGGGIGHTSGSYYRPIPFATHVKKVSIALTADVGGAVAFTYPSGRFTQAPAVVATVNNYYIYVIGTSGISTGGCTVGIRHYDGVVQTNTPAIHVFSIQMTPGNEEGRSAGPEPTDGQPEKLVSVTCHTVGCESAGQAIVLSIPDVAGLVVPVYCGVCHLEITDVVEV